MSSRYNLVIYTAFYKPERSLIILKSKCMSKIGYLGIYVSEGYSDFIILQLDKEVAEKAFRLYDVAEGHQQLGKIIDGLFKKGFEKVCCGVESTGGYENNWVNYVQELGKTKAVSIARINP